MCVSNFVNEGFESYLVTDSQCLIIEIIVSTQTHKGNMFVCAGAKMLTLLVLLTKLDSNYNCVHIYEAFTLS